MLKLPELGRVHDEYLALSLRGGALGGKLLFRSGFDAEGVAVLVAGGIAGAGCLCVESDAGLLRGGLRSGLCDFVVGQLDEALRILKNELRRQRPVSVGVAADPDLAVREMIERGLQPDLLSMERGNGFEAFLERGAVPLTGPHPAAGSSLLLWQVEAEPVRRMPQIACLAAEALDPERPDTAARRRWLEGAPPYLGRSFGHRQCLRMGPEEIPKFLQRLHSEIPAATVVCDGEPVPTPLAGR